MNICFFFTVFLSIYLSIKDYQIRLYKENKYVVITLKDSGNKETSDSISKQVWRLMKYTQGHNDKNLNMKFHLPVFILINEPASDATEKITEIKIMVTLPIEFQSYRQDGAPEEPPNPTEPDIKIETLKEFKCFVRYKLLTSPNYRLDEFKLSIKYLLSFKNIFWFRF